ncbi:(2Fe-2S)-binding protein [Bisbaumannia pacifica]|uniref:(2Fe-2S)-binding protein n=1 Tax=Bisbaumannia pacifica TaxID=77098 RepID=A0A510XA24_9GAMM|nr:MULTISPECIES: (2Fe-2S)-binding protein [Halomonas]MBH8580145.1 (2Fe-2S)-binding protein [Halomonas pacifica]GEK48286.1 (2Fe-2S)-binding protein [Halomonas pacifica]GKW47945.1 (2Fe-2S)-binding protein [Halomonas sp. NCCP-2165]
MFKRLDNAAPAAMVTIWLEGQPHSVPATLSAAAAVLWLVGATGYRDHAAGGHRAPLCMMGVCHDCLITIDGQPNRQGCLVPVAEGMRLERQRRPA